MMGKRKHPKAEINGKIFEIMIAPDGIGCDRCAFVDGPGCKMIVGDCRLVGGCYFKECKKGSNGTENKH